jgi:K+-sensing histidine kinase KdpD
LLGRGFVGEAVQGQGVDGSGIGLVLSRQIAEAHGGTLTLRNREPGPGAQALFTLPLQASDGRSGVRGDASLSPDRLAYAARRSRSTA